ncbi:putative odorant receptor 92a [Achroia grisella]|uniref:putative odorant receptor 92a n=1 Tax=Achroia grisella TaxID=688607 RepID=UPI0027D33F08|nr:putative odorant receptor 92a [Achroia grisella]
MEVPNFEEILKQVKINFWLIGIPFKDSNIKIRYYLFLISLIIMLIAELSFIVCMVSTADLLEITLLVPCSCIGLLSLLKIMPIAIKRKKIFKLADCLDNLYRDILNNTRNVEIVGSKIVGLKKIITYFFVLNGVLIAVYNFSNLALMFYEYITNKEVKYHLSYAVIVPFNIEIFGTWFFVFVFSCMNGYICVVFYTTVDALYCIFTSHICHHFTLISEEIKCLDTNNGDKLRELVNNHQYILKLSEDLEDIFNLPNLFTVLLGSIEICALGFNLTMGTWSQLPGCVLFLVSVLLQILMMSYFGENITRESNGVGEATFLCKWYDMNKIEKQNILIIMTRSHKPAQLTAYKFSIISYASFMKIISTSWSYFTILKTVYKPDIK